MHARQAKEQKQTSYFYLAFFVLLPSAFSQ
jgi:hypothetical protein